MKRLSDVDRHVALRLRAARVAFGMSQAAAAEHLGLTFQQVQKYENGKNRITAGRLALLSALYRKPILWFFEGCPGVFSGAPAARDVAGELMAKPHGLRLAEAFLAIQSGVDQSTLADVAEAIARKRAALQAAE